MSFGYYSPAASATDRRRQISNVIHSLRDYCNKHNLPCLLGEADVTSTTHGQQMACCRQICELAPHLSNNSLHRQTWTKVLTDWMTHGKQVERKRDSELAKAASKAIFAITASPPSLSSLENELSEQKKAFDDIHRPPKKLFTSLPATSTFDKTKYNAISQNTPHKENCVDPASGRRAIQELCENDIILGRGNAIKKFSGNEKFRLYVYQTKPMYAKASRNEKGGIAVRLVEHVMSQNPPGRFVECLVDEYYVVDYERAVEKTCQALREKNMQPPALFLEWEKQQTGKVNCNAKDRERHRLKTGQEIPEIAAAQPAKRGRKTGGKKTERAASKKSRKSENNHDDRKTKKQKQSASKTSASYGSSFAARPSSIHQNSAPTAEGNTHAAPQAPTPPQPASPATEFVSELNPSASYFMQLRLAELCSRQEVLASSQMTSFNTTPSSPDAVEITPFSKEADVAYILAGMSKQHQPFT